jgi:chromosome segregation ATPase
MTLNKTILEAIEATLPTMQVQAIHTALGELDELREYKKTNERDLKEMRQTMSDQRSTVGQLNDQVKKLASTNSDLEAQLAIATQRVREGEVAVAQAELAAVDRTVDRFLRNTIFREETQRSLPVTNSGSTVQYVNGQQQPTPYTSTSMQKVTDSTTSGNDLPESDKPV